MADENNADVKHKDEVTGETTTGHVWDGIQELNTPLPKWWLYTFYLTIIWGIIYVILFPAWPLINGATTGLLNWSTRANVQEEIDAQTAANAGLTDALLAADLNTVADNADLQNYAFNRGKSVFGAQCSQCHGAGANGGVGYPNLLDNDWLWGGSVDDIYYSLAHGIRDETDPETRFSEMPGFADILDREQIAQVSEYVYSLSNVDADAALAVPGGEIFAQECSACHGENAKGDRTQGAPNLTDAIWLFGSGSPEAIAQQVRAPRNGVMPSWSQRISDADVRAATIYVHSLGGGE